MTIEQETNHAFARSLSNAELGINTPWHVGFHTELADYTIAGTYQPDMVRFEAWRICDKTGKHIAFACTREAAYAIVDAMNAVPNAEITGSALLRSPG